jgi:hypothetical protein
MPTAVAFGNLPMASGGFMDVINNKCFLKSSCKTNFFYIPKLRIEKVKEP